MQAINGGFITRKSDGAQIWRFQMTAGPSPTVPNTGNVFLGSFTTRRQGQRLRASEFVCDGINISQPFSLPPGISPLMLAVSTFQSQKDANNAVNNLALLSNSRFSYQTCLQSGGNPNLTTGINPRNDTLKDLVFYADAGEYLSIFTFMIGNPFDPTYPFMIQFAIKETDEFL